MIKYSFKFIRFELTNQQSEEYVDYIFCKGWKPPPPQKLVSLVWY